MKNKAFTLIELLVVVLIIGILATIAVPQYKIAVKTAKFKSVLPIIQAIAQAEQSYYMANGTYTDKLEDLDINVPYTSKTGNYYYTDWGFIFLYANRGFLTFKVNNVAQVDYRYNPTSELPHICYFDNDEICHRFGTYWYADGNDKIYKLII